MARKSTVTTQDAIDKIILLILATACLFYLAFDANRDVNIYDEGVAVYGAQRICDGEMPYRDFWTMYAPGNFYILAGIFKIFGSTLNVARTWSVLVMWMLAVGAALLANRVSGRVGAAIAVLIVTTAAGSYGFYAQPIPTALVFTLASAYFFMDYLDRLRTRNLWLSGVFTGLATVVRHDIGLYTFLAQIFILAPFTFYILMPGNMKKRRKFRQCLKSMAPLGWGLILIIAPVAVLLAAFVPLREVIESLIVFPLKVYPKVRALPYPAILPGLSVFTNQGAGAYFAAFSMSLPFYFPLSIYILTTIQLFREAKADPASAKSADTRRVIFLIFLGLFLHNQATIRSAPPNLLPTMIPAAVLFAHLIYKVGKPSAKNIGAWILIVLACAALTGPQLRNKAYVVKLRLTGSLRHQFTLPAARGIYWDARTADYEKAVRFVQESSAENEKILVANENNGRIFINDVLFYFISGRASATRYHELHPGLATTEKIQKRIIEEIESASVRLVVLRREENSETGSKQGAADLDNFIRQHFSLTQSFGDYSVRLRNGGESLAQ